MLEGSTEVYEISPEAWRVMSLSFRVVLVWVDTDCEGVDGPGISDGIYIVAYCSDQLTNTSQPESGARDAVGRCLAKDWIT